MRWSSGMSCQFGMLNFNMRKGADLGWMPGRCKCCMHTVGFERHLLALFTENLWALFAHSNTKPLAFVLWLGRAGESACPEGARRAHRIHLLGKRLCHGCWPHWWGAWCLASLGMGGSITRNQKGKAMKWPVLWSRWSTRKNKKAEVSNLVSGCWMKHFTCPLEVFSYNLICCLYVVWLKSRIWRKKRSTTWEAKECRFWFGFCLFGGFCLVGLVLVVFLFWKKTKRTLFAHIVIVFPVWKVQNLIQCFLLSYQYQSKSGASKSSISACCTVCTVHGKHL